jgi:hypothetical protein
MQTFFIISGILGLIILSVVFKIRSMPQYKIIKEEDADGKEKWFIQVREGLFYKYLVQTKDLPGFKDDVFETSKSKVGGQDSEILAEKVIFNHRMTTINGIEVEGE